MSLRSREPSEQEREVWGDESRRGRCDSQKCHPHPDEQRGTCGAQPSGGHVGRARVSRGVQCLRHQNLKKKKMWDLAAEGSLVVASAVAQNGRM